MKNGSFLKENTSFLWRSLSLCLWYLRYSLQHSSNSKGSMAIECSCHNLHFLSVGTSASYLNRSYISFLSSLQELFSKSTLGFYFKENYRPRLLNFQMEVILNILRWYFHQKFPWRLLFFYFFIIEVFMIQLIYSVIFYSFLHWNLWYEVSFDFSRSYPIGASNSIYLSSFSPSSSSG